MVYLCLMKVDSKYGQVCKIMEFKKWFNKKLDIGSYPITQNAFYSDKKYDVCINMSDEWYPDIDKQIKSLTPNVYWFPMNEAKNDVGINSIYGAMNILYNAYKENQKVYLHCHAGINRSQATGDAFWFMMLDKHRETNQSNGFINRLVKLSGYGYLPEKLKIENYLRELKVILDSHLISDHKMGGQLDTIKLNNV